MFLALIEMSDVEGPLLIVSDPSNELAVKNARAVKDTKELYMAHRSIDVIGGFEVFVNLEVLWLNHNKVSLIISPITSIQSYYIMLSQLTSIDSLDANIRIKSLYAFNNEIT